MKTSQSKRILFDIYDALLQEFGPQHWWPGDSPFEIAVGAILTQNTNWGNVEKAIQNIKREQCLYAKTLHEMPHAKLASLIKPAGYFNVKAKRLRNFLSFLLNHYKGSMKRMDVSDTALLRESLLNVNGIGPETADSILLYALGRPIFVIDAYTKRVLHRHGIVSHDTTYHEMQELFHNNLPEDVQLFNEYHALFVMVGKHYCKPRARCEGCPLESIPHKI
jgi:endonuclease-3 related protein